MAASIPELIRLAPLAALLLAGAVQAAEPAGAIDLKGAAFNYDSDTNRLLLPQIEIQQGAMSIRADEGSINGIEANFSNSEWHFRGAVHITFEGGELDASEATVKFVANRLQSAHVTGTPATFSHQGKQDEVISRGRANTIDYNAQQTRVVFSGDVWFGQGESEVTTRAPLTYNLSNRGISSPERVHIRIPGEELPDVPKPDAAPKEAP